MRSLLGVTRELGGIKGCVYQLEFMKLVRIAKSTAKSGLVRDKVWFKGVLTSEKLGSLIDSELLIYCLQVDYILNRIWVYPLKSLCSTWTTPLLLSTVDAISTALTASLCTVDVIAHWLVVLLSPVVVTPQP
jgi:hypothetical protein